LNKSEIFEGLRNAVIQGDADKAEDLAKKAQGCGLDPIEAIENGLNPGMKQVGEAFEKGEVFLVDLVLGGEAMKRATTILEEEIARKGLQDTRARFGRIVIGTVAGDIHDIGKSIVSSLLKAAGFDMIDLGIDVPTEKFIESVQEYHPDILALSALLSVTALTQDEVIRALKIGALRDRVKVMVGGGSITEKYATDIGADGYGEDAEEAVEIALKLLGK